MYRERHARCAIGGKHTGSREKHRRRWWRSRSHDLPDEQTSESVYPIVRFATAVFIVLNHDSSECTYVNAGHNAAIVVGSGSAQSLEPTGMPLGLFPEAVYTIGQALLPPGGTPPFFSPTDLRIQFQGRTLKGVCAMI